MTNPYPRPITIPESSGLMVHYTIPNVYGIRFYNLYDEEECDNWLITELVEGRYKLYKIPNTTLFQAIKQTTNRAEREIIELHYTAEIDRPLAEDQLTLPDGAWTLDEYPGVAESIRLDPLPPARLLQPPTQTGGISSLLAAALLLDRPLAQTLWDLGDDTDPVPILWRPREPFLLPYSCTSIQRPSLAPPQKRVADLMIADAIAKGESCSITMNPLTSTNAACVAPCYHTFEQEAIQTWLATNTTCPTCRQPCTL